MDREEFFRLKKVKGVKERAQAEEEEERKKKAASRRDSDKENEGQAQEEPSEGKNILGDEGDEDVIF